MGVSSVVVPVTTSGPAQPAADPPSQRVAPAHGLRLTLRHQAILVAHCALLLVVLRPYVDTGGRWAYFNATIAALLISPWLLAALVLVFDRPGPLKYWLAPLSLSLLGPILALCYDLNAAASWTANGTPPRILLTVAVNAFFIGSFLVYLRHAGPTTCPTCSRRALVPLYSVSGTTPRTSSTRWCAACGVRLWRRDRGESWQPERRKT